MQENRVHERFLRYVRIDTRSNQPKKGEEEKRPSSEGQLILGSMIKEELIGMGVQFDQVLEFYDGSFLVHFNATSGNEECPHVVFAAHMDTYYGFSGNVNPQTHIYNGGDIVLTDKVSIPASDLSGLEGKAIITTDGTSVLGADDKAGLVIMVEAIHHLLEHKPMHGELSFWFCVDEEIGKLDVKVIPEELVSSWSILWTVDGERQGIIDVESMYCRYLTVYFHGMDAHPGLQAEKLRPSQYAAIDFMSAFDSEPLPWTTKEKECFYYICDFQANAQEARILFAPRSFDLPNSNTMADKIKEQAAQAAKKWNVEFDIKDDMLCINMGDAIENNQWLLQVGVEAHKKHGFDPRLNAARAGTDGAMLNMTYPSIPAPNMGTGAFNLHGPQEFLVFEDFEAAIKIVLSMIEGYAAL